MKGQLILFVCLTVLSSIGNGLVEEKQIPSDGKYAMLDPTATEMTYNLKSQDGSKLVLNCISAPDCSQISIVIDTGNKVSDVCNEMNLWTFNASVENSMKVEIKTLGLNQVKCRVKATLPYINNIDEPVDSSEFGQGNPSGPQPTCQCGWRNKNANRIVGGQNAKVNEFPWQVLMIDKEAESAFCGGSIITPYHILTAAHCTEGYSPLGREIKVVVGLHSTFINKKITPDAAFIDVAEIVQHPGYTHASFLNDISILYLSEKIKISKLVGPACMPSSPQDLLNEYVTVTGWGAIATRGKASPVLKKVNLKVIEDLTCEARFRLNENRTQFCTYSKNKDSCQGDSGGPVVHVDKRSNFYTQVGIVSYGIECAGTDPGVNTDVFPYIKWIEDSIASTF